MKRKRPDLIGIEIRTLQHPGAYNGSFTVTVYNNTVDAIRHSIGIESSSPVIVYFGEKIINPLNRASTFSETKPVSVDPDSTENFLFHWIDVDRSPKFVNIRAKFKHVKSESISF